MATASSTKHPLNEQRVRLHDLITTVVESATTTDGEIDVQDLVEKLLSQGVRVVDSKNDDESTGASNGDEMEVDAGQIAAPQDENAPVQPASEPKYYKEWETRAEDGRKLDKVFGCRLCEGLEFDRINKGQKNQVSVERHVEEKHAEDSKLDILSWCMGRKPRKK